MSTGSISTYGTTPVSGVANVAVRLGRGLEAWGLRIAEPETREQLVQRRAIELEARAAVLARGDARSGMYQLLG